MSRVRFFLRAPSKKIRRDKKEKSHGKIYLLADIQIRHVVAFQKKKVRNNMFNSKKRRIRNLEASFEGAYKTIMELGKEIERLENLNRYYKYLADVRKANANRVYGLNNTLKDINATYEKEMSDLCERLKEEELILQAIKENGLLKTSTADRIQFATNVDGKFIGKEIDEMKNKKIMVKKGGKKPC